MKKLMIAAAIVCAAVAANAAVCNWDAGDVYKCDGSSDLASNYLVFYADSASYSYADAQKAVAKGDISFLSLETTLTSVGVYNGDGFVVGSMGGYGDGVAVNAYTVILNSSSSSSATMVYLGSEGSGATGATGQAAQISFNTSSSQLSGNWTSIPEPTSGLLLLLGVAGLALKRKRA